MTKEKIKKLESMGFKVTTTRDWLQLSVEEEKVIEMRVALAAELEKMRKEAGLTQAQLAKKLGTKQSGVARMINNPLVDCGRQDRRGNAFTVRSSKSTRARMSAGNWTNCLRKAQGAAPDVGRKWCAEGRQAQERRLASIALLL